MENKPIKIKCYGEEAEGFKKNLDSGVSYSLEHIDGDPLRVYRFYLKSESFSLELTPSRGLSVRDFTYHGKDFFWDSPLPNLIDPENVAIEKPMLIHGELVEGTRWIEYFSSHIEMLGLDNWGMPSEKNGRILGLHGNVSSIPVNEIFLTEEDDRLIVSGVFYVYDPNNIFAKSTQDTPYFKVEKQIVVYLEKPALLIKDTITNVGVESRMPDWGYHVQLKPEAGCRYLVPSKVVTERGTNSTPERDFEVWEEALISEERVERGFIHKEIDVTKNAFPDGSKGVETLLVYANGSGIKCIIPHAPYTLSWFSHGGGNGSEFLIPGEEGDPAKKFLFKNWDGVGPEIGASDLDNNDDTDPKVTPSILAPKESLDLQIYLELVDKDDAKILSSHIEGYNNTGVKN